MRALSVRQPYAELIMREEKRVKYRSKPTRIMERVYVYATKRPGKWMTSRQLGCGQESYPRVCL